MNKYELIKKCNEIILKTNGSNEDYVVALCQISMAINELDDLKLEECYPVDVELENGVTYWGCSNCGEQIYGSYNHCPNCGKKIRREK